MQQQQRLVARKKYTAEAQAAHAKLLHTSPNLEPEEVVRKLKLSVKVPNFRIDPNDLEDIIRNIVCKPKNTDPLLPQSKRQRAAAAGTTSGGGGVREAEINWCFTHQNELPDITLTGMCPLIAQLRKRCVLLSHGYWKIGAVGLCTLVTGDRGSGRTSLIRHVVKEYTQPDQVNYIEVSCNRIQACAKPNLALQDLKEFLSSADQSRGIVCFVDDLDVLLPAGRAASKNGDEGVGGGAGRKLAYIMTEIIEVLRNMSTGVWLVAAAVSKVTIDADFLRHSPLGSEECRIPPLDVSARQELFDSALAREASIHGCRIESQIDSRPYIVGTRGWTAHQLLLTVAMVISESIDEWSETMPSTPLSVAPVLRLADMSDAPELPPEFPSVTPGAVCRAFQRATNVFAPEGFMDIPAVTMDDVGGLREAKQLMSDYVIRVMQNIELHRSMGFEDSSGILMWGPPGCGKTHLAKAVANACQARFILVKGSELLDKYVGASEQKVKELFERASDHAPCLIFFDEFDALCPARSKDGLHEVSRRVVNSMLIELDGVNKRSGVFVIAATNEPTLIDEAVLRSGRFEHKVLIPPPDYQSRAEIIRVQCRGKPWHIDDSVIDAAANATDGCTGADLKFILNNAALACWDAQHKRIATNSLEITLQAILDAISRVRK